MRVIIAPTYWVVALSQLSVVGISQRLLPLQSRDSRHLMDKSRRGEVVWLRLCYNKWEDLLDSCSFQNTMLILSYK